MLIAELTFKIIKSTDIPIDLRNKFNANLAGEAHKLGELLFKTAQNFVPYDSGNLHESAKLQSLHNGFRITYNTHYAYPLHAGESIADTSKGQNYVADTRQHIRRLPGGKTVLVRRHKKTYRHGHKPMLISSSIYGIESWKAINVTKKYNAAPWITWAWESVVSSLRQHKNPLKVTIPFTKEVLINHLVIKRGTPLAAKVLRMGG